MPGYNWSGDIKIMVERTHVNRLVLGDLVARAKEQRVGQVTLLVDDTCERAVVVVPRSGWFPGEALDATKGRVLDDHCS